MGRVNHAYRSLAFATCRARGLAAAGRLLDLDERRNLAECEHLICGGGRKQVHRTGDHSGPTSLVTRPQPGAIVAMEVLVELEVVAPVRVFLELLLAAVHRTATVLTLQE